MIQRGLPGGHWKPGNGGSGRRSKRNFDAVPCFTILYCYSAMTPLAVTKKVLLHVIEKRFAINRRKITQ